MQKSIAIQDSSRAEILNSEKSPASLRKSGGKGHAKPSASRGGAGKVGERREVEEPISEPSEAQKSESSRPEARPSSFFSLQEVSVSNLVLSEIYNHT